ncbi:MAG: hypothetical protein C0408_02485 [Odoribacter sp.]|nr:hypothetical protein [Odoribacter sp.]
MKTITKAIMFLSLLILINCCQNKESSTAISPIPESTISAIQDELIAKHLTSEKERIIKGVKQLAGNWRSSDGSENDFQTFCLENFLSDSIRTINFPRICSNLIAIGGHMDKIRFRITEYDRFTDVEEVYVDRFFRESLPILDPYKKKLAHLIQLNFPFYTLEEKRESGSRWSREQWAMARLGDYYSSRKDPDFKGEASDEVDNFIDYMDRYFFRMDHICMPDGSYPFQNAAYLHSHRGIRDNIKEEYTRTGGLARQELSLKVVEHVVMGTVPLEFIKDTTTRWNPWTNDLSRLEADSSVKMSYTNEGTVRYAGLRSVFLHESSQDRFYEAGSTFIKRNFERQNFHMEEVEKLLRDFLSDPTIASVGKIIENRLGRPLQPFDLWYSGFQEQSTFPADELDSITRKRYPDPIALQKNLPAILVRMGFTDNEAAYIGSHISVRPVISGGYTNQPVLRGDTVLMTTMFNPDGLDYKSYRVAMHELGHSVCGVFSTRDVDNFILAGVPTNGIDEGMAELMAYRNIRGLGLKTGDAIEQKNSLALATLWYLFEMGGQALTDIEVWKWMYSNPGFTASELQEAVITIAGKIWNNYFSNVFNGIKDQHILAIYNHFIGGQLYLYNYFIGNVTMFQFYNAFEGKNMSAGLMKACSEGTTLPDLWMEHAVGEKISTADVIKASAEAVTYFSKK